MQLLIPRYLFPWLFASYLSFDLDSKAVTLESLQFRSLFLKWDLSPTFSHADHSWSTRVFLLDEPSFQGPANIPQSSLPTLPYPRSCQLPSKRSPLDPFILCPPSQPQPTHLAPARFLPSTCLESFTASSKTDPCSTFLVEEVSPVWIVSHLPCKLHVSLSFLVHADCYRLTRKGRTSVTERVQSSKGRYKEKRNGVDRKWMDGTGWRMNWM